MSVRLRTFERGLLLFPTIGLIWMRYYYGYPVLCVNFVWLKWQLIFKIGVRKVKDYGGMR